MTKIQYVIKFKNTRNFKIRSKADARTFLEEMFTGEKHIIVTPKTVLGIYHRKDEAPYTTSKYGDPYDVFNPEYVNEFEESVKLIYIHRKAVNNEFFNYDER